MGYDQLEGYAALVNASRVGEVKISTCTGAEYTAILLARAKEDWTREQRKKKNANTPVETWDQVGLAKTREEMLKLKIKEDGRYFMGWSFKPAAAQEALRRNRLGPTFFSDGAHGRVVQVDSMKTLVESASCMVSAHRGQGGSLVPPHTRGRVSLSLSQVSALEATI